MWAMDDSFSQARPLWYPRENSEIYPKLSLREDTGGCGGGTALVQGASDIRGAPRFSAWSMSVPPSSGAHWMHCSDIC